VEAGIIADVVDGVVVGALLVKAGGGMQNMNGMGGGNVGAGNHVILGGNTVEVGALLVEGGIDSIVVSSSPGLVLSLAGLKSSNGIIVSE